MIPGGHELVFHPSEAPTVAGDAINNGDRRPLSFAVGRFLGSQLYGINPYNPGVTLAAVLALGCSGLVASVVPAVRASMISPLDALRAE